MAPITFAIMIWGSHVHCLNGEPLCWYELNNRDRDGNPYYSEFACNLDLKRICAGPREHWACYCRPEEH